MIQIQGQGFTAYIQDDGYFVLLDGPLSPQERDVAAAKAVEKLDFMERANSLVGQAMAEYQANMRRAIFGGLDV